MANKQTDVSKLFREKFESFELDNSANIELAMNKKLQTAKFWKMVKWGILIIVLSSLSLYVILPNQEDKDFSQNHIEDNNVEITTQKETVSNKQITLVKEEIISEVKEQTITNKKGNNNPTFNDHRQTNEPINQDINESELFATHRDILKYLASKTNSLKYKKPKTVTIEKTDLKLQLKKITEKPKAPKEASSFPNKNLSNIAAYGEFQISPLMFYNIKSPSLPTSDTLTQSQINGSPQISYEIGIAIKLQKRNKPWFLQTGLNYQDFREKVDYSFRKEYIDHNLSFWDYDSIYEYHFDPPNIDTVLVGVDSSYMDHWVKTENKKTNINSYTYPIHI
ncbi:MAG: hypothetical protein B7C24_14965 [Bacteroidetes bacterium 4572_77]|nr:MAG: hypothetical protein B7C24_14965 [Bacteroidetes bacterium 4572_77]